MWAGAYPYDPFWGYGGYGHVGYASGGNDPGCGCCSCCWNTACRPLAILCFVFPVMPENAVGGWFGKQVGTHAFTEAHQVYTPGGNSCLDGLIHFLGMGWRRRADLHENADWRAQVHEFLTGDRAAEAAGTEYRNQRGRHRNLEYQRISGGSDEQTRNRAGHLVRTIGRAHVCYTEPWRSFEQAGDQCVESSFRDYEMNQCWICMSSGGQVDANGAVVVAPIAEWDLWLSCHHMFCSSCSEEMLTRRMPCPLCRVFSSTALRGASFGTVTELQDDDDAEVQDNGGNGNGNAAPDSGA